MKIEVPVQPLQFQTKNFIYIKRDDLIPYSFGGNKARKAFYFFKEIDDGDHDCVVTYGSSSSNHCRVVANMCAERGLACYIICPREASGFTFNSMMTDVFGAHRIIVDVENVHDAIEFKLAKLREDGKKPYFIPGGGHGNLGTQAYVDCYNEIKDYEIANNIYFDYIFFASGTGTTQAGLVCGQLINGDSRKIVGISIARKNPRGRQVVIDSIKEYLSEKRFVVSDMDVERNTLFIDEYTGAGYGKNNSAILERVRNLLIKTGIPMDTTYTGKAFYGMQKYLQENQIVGKNILFIHTGGTPLFFDDLKGMEL